MSNPFTHNEYRAAVLRINQQLLELELSGPIANESPAQKARLDTIEQEVIALNDEIDQMQAAFRWIDTGVSNPETGAPVLRPNWLSEDERYAAARAATPATVEALNEQLERLWEHLMPLWLMAGANVTPARISKFKALKAEADRIRDALPPEQSPP